jgi:hypothetical protein
MKRPTLVLLGLAACSPAAAQSSSERSYAAWVAQDVVEICLKDAADCVQLARCLAIALGVVPLEATAFDPPLGSYDEQRAERRGKCPRFERLLPNEANLTSITGIASDTLLEVDP